MEDLLSYNWEKYMGRRMPLLRGELALKGITCHTAIVSRFKDGDIVEIDAEKGVVRKIK